MASTTPHQTLAIVVDVAAHAADVVVARVVAHSAARDVVAEDVAVVTVATLGERLAVTVPHAVAAPSTPTTRVLSQRSVRRMHRRATHHNNSKCFELQHTV